MIRVVIAGALMLTGLFTLAVAVIGVFRLSAAMNRIHLAAKFHTMGALLILSGLMLLSGFNALSVKLLLLIVLLWLCSSAAGHIAARSEVRANHNMDSICDYVDLTEGENTNDNN